MATALTLTQSFIALVSSKQKMSWENRSLKFARYQESKTYKPAFSKQAPTNQSPLHLVSCLVFCATACETKNIFFKKKAWGCFIIPAALRKTPALLSSSPCHRNAELGNLGNRKSACQKQESTQRCLTINHYFVVVTLLSQYSTWWEKLHEPSASFFCKSVDVSQISAFWSFVWRGVVFPRH